MKPRIARLTLRPALLALAALALIGLAGQRAVHAASTTASATAVVLTPMAITKHADLVFGNVVAGNGVVTVSTAGARTLTGGTPLVSGVTAAAARFDVTGDTSQGFAITVTPPANLISGSDTLPFTWFGEVSATTTPAGVTSGQPATGTLTSGAAYIFMGGTVTVGAAQPTGTYTGTITVQVEYN
jgi:spore coat protein U-like protein